MQVSSLGCASPAYVYLKLLDSFDLSCMTVSSSVWSDVATQAHPLEPRYSVVLYYMPALLFSSWSVYWHFFVNDIFWPYLNQSIRKNWRLTMKKISSCLFKFTYMSWWSFWPLWAWLLRGDLLGKNQLKPPSRSWPLVTDVETSYQRVTRRA